MYEEKIIDYFKNILLPIEGDKIVETIKNDINNSNTPEFTNGDLYKNLKLDHLLNFTHFSWSNSITNILLSINNDNIKSTKPNVDKLNRNLHISFIYHYDEDYFNNSKLELVLYHHGLHYIFLNDHLELKNLLILSCEYRLFNYNIIPFRIKDKYYNQNLKRSMEIIDRWKNEISNIYDYFENVSYMKNQYKLHKINKINQICI